MPPPSPVATECGSTTPEPSGHNSNCCSEPPSTIAVRHGPPCLSVSAATSAAESARAEIGAIEEQEREVRDSYHEVQDRLSHLSSQVDAREALERGYEGFAPAVGALMARFDRSAGVRGPLVDFLDGRGGRAEVGRVEG